MHFSFIMSFLSVFVGMKPLEYLNEYVNVTNTYRLVYYRIFKLHARTIANAEYIEKTVNIGIKTKSTYSNRELASCIIHTFSNISVLKS